MEISKKTIGFCLLIGRSCQDDVVDIGASSAAAISDSFAAASDMNSIVLLLYYYMMMLMRSLVVLSLFFDDEEQNQTRYKTLKKQGSLSCSLSLSFLFLSSLVIATNCTQTFFFILFFSKETILKVFASNKRIKHTHTRSHTHTHSKTNLSVFLWKSSSHPSVRFFSSSSSLCFEEREDEFITSFLSLPLLLLLLLLLFFFFFFFFFFVFVPPWNSKLTLTRAILLLLTPRNN